MSEGWLLGLDSVPLAVSEANRGATLEPATLRLTD